ncbi:alpha beta hydrolase fold family [Grosmannia clavigera kw1407]|uniref:Alpha beta hydrolase fold family n=1 Tax=Grosmannia clavigera (strain kw1407 / UAMH 11150) TaxID=655863 RepID=F0XAB0_GROCL|nr:alpha beta hydrolase fold family [Grosmannia clavigera kw1407]EFX05997.1 alpha beta hydrolase fold family [Grosmannia clavigera kw1407]
MADEMHLSTVEEVLKHPSYPDATFNLKPTSSGLLPVAEGRGGPLKIGWEIHGSGPIRMVFIMGLGSFKSSWQRQTLYFGHERHADFSVLLVDNRGMGDSDKPLMRYSTSEMALDVVEVLEHVGFVERTPAGSESAAGLAFTPASQRAVHVIGVSMGGMIAQELACMAPTIVASLSLCCTAAAIENTSPTIWQNLASRAALIVPKGVEESVRGAAGRIFAHDWLPQPDNVQLPKRGTHLVGPPQRGCHGDQKQQDDTDDKDDPWYRLFDNNYQRFVAQEMHKRLDPRFSTAGFLMQLIACGWHHKSPQQLVTMADQIGRDRILVLHGTADHMISLPHGRKLIEYIQPGAAHIIEGMGHAPLAERCTWYNNLLEERARAGEKLAGR